MFYYKLVSFFIGLLLVFLGTNTAFAAISFTISNPQYNNNEVTIDVTLSSLTSTSCPNSFCYLQAALTSSDPIRYFGFTKNNSGQWYEYISSPTQSYIQSAFFNFQPVSGAWSGQLALKINTESPNYHGPGTYNIKAWRYSGNSNSASGNSNVLTVDIPSSTSIPASTPSPSQTSSNSTESNSTTSSTSSFTISNLPSEINSDESFTASVNLSLPNNPDSTFYLKGAFKKADSLNYFGLTRVSGSWIKNGSTYSNQFSITSDSSGNWSGNLEIKPDSEDSGFTGSGDYIFKVARYTSTGSGPTWSNESTINIVSVESIDQGGTSVDNSPPTTSPSSSPLSGQSAKTKSSGQSKSSNTLAYHSATVAAATTSASPPTVAVKTQKNTSNFITWIGTGLILTGTSILAYIYLRSSNLHETISNLFRKRN